MKSKEIRPYNLPRERVLLSEIDAKPNGVFIAVFLLGVMSIIVKLSTVFGLVLIIFALSSLFLMPKVVLLEFYNDYLVVFNKADKDNCFIAYYEDIDSWFYTWSPGKDYLHIIMQDNSEIKVEGFSKTIFEKRMNRFLRNKHKKK